MASIMPHKNQIFGFVFPYLTQNFEQIWAVFSRVQVHEVVVFVLVWGFEAGMISEAFPMPIAGVRLVQYRVVSHLVVLSLASQML